MLSLMGPGNQGCTAVSMTTHLGFALRGSKAQGSFVAKRYRHLL